MARPVIDYKKCKNRLVCIEVCPVGVFAKEGKKVVVKHPEECINCRACEVQCPEKAIKVKE
jgi:NAD-dependent dihydropyrimidine dehydrogenase PreA subunit